MADKARSHAPRPRRGEPSGPSLLQDKSKLARLGLLAGLLVALVVVLVVVYMPGEDASKKRSWTPPPVAEAGPPAPAPAPAPEPEAAPAPEPSPPSQADQPPEESPPGGEADMNEGAYPQETQPPGYGPGEPMQPAEQPQLPEDVAKWKGQDFYDARKAGDPRLIEAVGQLARRAPGSVKVAENLAKLLAPPAEEEATEQGPQPGYRSQSGGRDPRLVEAIVAALGANGTDAARAILGQLLAGTLSTDDDKTAVDAALKALAGDPSQQTDALLFCALTAPEKLRSQPNGEIGPEQLREMALAVVSSTASETLRTTLALFLVQPTTPPAWREQMAGFLQEQHPDNVGAQLILYQSDQTPQETRATFEQYFMAYSSAAMAHVLGIPATQTDPAPGGLPGGNANWRGAPGGSGYGTEYDGPRGGRPNPPAGGPGYGQPGPAGADQPVAGPADPDAPYRRAGQLWSAQTAAMVEARLGKLTSLGEEAPLALLAGTFPVDSTRSALWETLHKHANDGPEQLESAGLTTQVISDPGLLLSIKTLPRRHEEEAAVSTVPGGSGGSYGTADSRQRRGYQRTGDTTQRVNRFRPGSRSPSGQSPSTTGTADTASSALERQLQAERAWMKTSESLVRAWCRRLDAAAAAGAGAGNPAGGQPAATLPIKLHPQANVVSEYHLSWPGELGSKLSGIAPGPMEVHYVRIEEKADPVTRVGFYRRQLGGLRLSDVRTVANGSWLDRLQSVPKANEQGPVDKTGWRRSTDVLVTLVQDDPERERGEPTDLVVEILSVEMKDPAKE